MSDSGYRDWMDALAVGDELFAQAYSGLSGELRAWIKQTAAQAHALAGAPLDDCVDIRIGRRQGYRTLHARCPLEHAVMFIDSTCVSAPRVAAAAVPLVLSGARNVCAVRIDEGEPFADSVLAALELCGVETVFHMHEHDARRFTESLANGGSAAVLFFGQGMEISALATAAGYAAPPLKLWKPLPAERLGVWAGAGGEWDWEAMCWAHPCTSFEVWGLRTPGVELPVSCTRMRGGFEAMLESDYPALYVPEDRLADASGHAPLVLAPGQEGCWAWPDLPTSFFRSETLAIGGWNR